LFPKISQDLNKSKNLGKVMVMDVATLTPKEHC
jgi:hypothetical protein